MVAGSIRVIYRVLGVLMNGDLTVEDDSYGLTLTFNLIQEIHSTPRSLHQHEYHDVNELKLT